ncbi:hypothetical protein [Thiococcus pfennigii]|uniref:hypothetical protein n=1 Tax=Thiococcus pfennigii TaxID=1057 RepID=UPI001907F2BE|nr:hypothetical protein [Thiococcus pfennigii]
MQIRFSSIAFAVLVGVAVTGGPVFAQGNGVADSFPESGAVPFGQVVPDGTWYEFSFTGTGTDARGCQPADPGGLACASSPGTVFADSPPWTFSGPAIVTVTDAFANGDSFEVFDSSASLGATPNVAASGSCGSDPDVCAADPASSTASFVVGAGLHSLTIRPTASPIGSGAAFFKVEQVENECDRDGDGDFDLRDVIVELRTNGPVAAIRLFLECRGATSEDEAAQIESWLDHKLGSCPSRR